MNQSKRKRAAVVIANPTVSTTPGWPAGFWWSELTHTYYRSTEEGYEIDIFSPNGGKCEADAMSDPRDGANVANVLMASVRSSACQGRRETERRSGMFATRPIGYVRSPFKDTREIPKGLGAKHQAEGLLEIQAEFAAGLKDIEGFSHLFVIWEFDRSDGFDLVGKPPSDDRPHGVFATRSPRRPNPLGLTVVELLGREGPALRVRGVDMLEGTPILDIKPYLSNVAPETLRRGWLAEAEARALAKP